MKDTLRLLMMGPVLVERAGSAINGFESRKALALMCYLALEAKPVSRALLADMFWGEKSERSGRNNLSRVLSNLGSRMPDCLEADRQSIQFVRSPSIWIDVDAFCYLESEGEIPQLVKATGLYRGEMLEGLMLDDCPEFDLWLLAKRETWRQRVTDLLHRLVSHYEAQQDYRQSLAFASRLLELEPWREEAHRTRMTLLARSGQRSAALAQYEICRRVLAEEFKAEPSPETTALYEQILGNISQHKLASKQAFAFAALPPATAFVGRIEHLARLQSAIGAPEHRLLTLAGMGGAGKTRLLQEALRLQEPFGDVKLLYVALDEEQAREKSQKARQQAVVDFKFLDELAQAIDGQPCIVALDGVGDDSAARALPAQALALDQVQQVIVTARSRMSIQSEWVLDVGGVGFPSAVTDPQFDEYEAIELFTAAARRTLAGFRIEPEHRTDLIRICEAVGGLPLALELAAEWVHMLTLKEIAREVEHNLDFLSSKLGDRPDRHCTMRSILESTWRHLSGSDQGAAKLLAAMSDGYERERKAEKTGLSLANLAALTERYLLFRDQAGRYQLHPLFKQFVAEQAALAA